MPNHKTRVAARKARKAVRRFDRRSAAFEAEREDELYWGSRAARVAQFLEDQERRGWAPADRGLESDGPGPGPGLESRDDSEEIVRNLLATDAALRRCAQRDAVYAYAKFGSPVDRAPGGRLFGGCNIYGSR